MEPTETTIHLTDRPPVRIRTADWPIVARVVWPEDREESARSTHRAYVRIRRHQDGRTIVYGLHAEGSYEQRVGFLVHPGGDAVTAVRNACALVGLDPQGVFDHMPAEQL